MRKLALWPYPHIKKNPKLVVPASKGDIDKLVRRLEFVAKVRLLSAGTRRKLLKKLRQEGKL